MEVGRKYILQYTTSSLFSKKGRLKGARICVILFIFISLVLDFARHFNGGVAIARDFTSIVMLLYFIVVLAVSYKFTTTSTYEISTSDKILSQSASVLFAISMTSALFDSIFFWVFLFRYYHPPYTFFIFNSYVFNLVIMILEALWSLMLIPASRFIFAIIASGVYVGVYFLWDHLDYGYLINLHVLPDIGIPKYALIVLIVVVLYNVCFWMAYGLIAFRTRVYHHGLFSKEETYHILDSQTF